MPSYKILKVNDFGQICIDVNNDLICQEDEYYKLKDISYYFPYEKEYTKKSNDFLKNLLQGKEIKLKEPLSLFYKYAKIDVDNTDVAIVLLKEGFAEPHNKNVPVDYLLAFDKNKFLKNFPVYKPKKPAASKEFIEKRTPNFVNGAIELYLINPNLYSLPSKRARTNLAQAIIYNINNSKTSIEAALYGLENQDEILNALIKAKNRGAKLDLDNKDAFNYVWKRWQDKDEKMFEAMEYFKIIDFETKKQLSLEIIDYIRKCKNKFQ